MLQNRTLKIVPKAMDIIDIVLHDTQTTASVVHPQWQVSRIREFYTKKIKITSEGFNRILRGMLEDFPVINELPAFWESLFNTLFHKDQYKLALARVSVATSLISRYCRDYIKLINTQKSAYACKRLKIASLGMMCSIVRRLGDSLLYLEQVRQHINRLPAIDTNAPMILLAGYPQVGKSALFSKMSSGAYSEIADYAGTTKSLFLGHFYHRNTKVQVIDTPGMLDQPLSKRNQLERQTLNALVHLQAAVLFLIDISSKCSIEDQVNLCNNLRVLFVDKPFIIVLTKTDLRKPSELDKEDQALLKKLATETKATIKLVSNLTESGVSKLRVYASDMLLKARSTQSIIKGNKNPVLMSVYVSTPNIRDQQPRPSRIPQSVLDSRVQRTLSKELLEHALIRSKFATDARDEKGNLIDLAKYEYDLSSSVTQASSVRNRLAVEALKKIKEIALNRKAQAALDARDSGSMDTASDSLEDYLDGADRQLWEALLAQSHDDGRPNIVLGTTTLGGNPKMKNLEKFSAQENPDTYQYDYNKRWLLANPEWKYDTIPEQWEGHVIADFYDLKIREKLHKLEGDDVAYRRQIDAETQELLANNATYNLSELEKQALKTIFHERALLKNARADRTSLNHAQVSHAQMKNADRKKQRFKDSVSIENLRNSRKVASARVKRSLRIKSGLMDENMTMMNSSDDEAPEIISPAQRKRNNREKYTIYPQKGAPYVLKDIK